MQELSELPQKKLLQDLSAQFANDKIDIRDIFYNLLAEKWLILIITGIALVFGILSALNKVPLYQANVLLQVENKQGNGLGFLAKSAAGGSLGSEMSDSSSVQIALIKSRYVLTPVIEKLGLNIVASPRYFPYFGQLYAQMHNQKLHAPLFNKPQYAWGGEHIEVADFTVPISEQSNSYKLVADKDFYKIFTPEGKMILTCHVGETCQIKKDNQVIFGILVKSLVANTGTEFFISKILASNVADELAREIDILDIGEQSLMSKTGVLQMSLRGKSPEYVVELLNEISETVVKSDLNRKALETAKMLLFLEKQLDVVKNSLNESEQALNHYRMESGTIDLTVKSRLILNQLVSVERGIERANLIQVKLLQRFTPAHPAVIGAKKEREALEKKLLSLEKQLQTIPSSDQIAVNLIRDVKVKSQLYISLLHKIHELEVVKAGTVSDVRILSLANTPTRLPSGRAYAVISSVLAGLVLGCLIAFGRRWLNSRIEDPNWFEQQHGVPTFAIVPYSESQKIHAKSFKEKKRNGSYLLAQKDPRDMAIEALRSLRTSLQFALIGAKNNIISIMGVSPSVGKSFIATNFSHVLADAGKRVLLIDADLRRGYLHEYFNLPKTPGLSELLAGTTSLQEVIQDTHLPNLKLIAAGKLPPNPSELIMHDRFKALLDTVSSDFDLVVIDTAPVLAVSDSLVVGNYAGVNFLILGAGRHQAEEINMAVKRLQSNAIKLHGMIFNYTHARKSTVQRKFNYHYEYGATQMK